MNAAEQAFQWLKDRRSEGRYVELSAYSELNAYGEVYEFQIDSDNDCEIRYDILGGIAGASWILNDEKVLENTPKRFKTILNDDTVITVLEVV